MSRLTDFLSDLDSGKPVDPALLFSLQIYTFVDLEGINTHIDSEALREWCLSHSPETFSVPIDQKFAASMLGENCISVNRVLELAFRLKKRDPKLTITPIIFVKDGVGDNGHPNVMLVDGHHRYALAALLDLPSIRAHVLDESDWRPFQIHNHPSLTREQLIASPILKRNY